jgi:hypothetical protein
MVNIVCGWVDLVRDVMTAEAGRRVLRHYIHERLRQGTIPTMQVIAAAEAGHQDADMALRQLAAEHIDRREEMPTALANYVQRALVMPPVTYPPGRNLVDTWLRDVIIAVLVRLAVERLDLPATRSRASKRPSACSVVALALTWLNITTRRVEKIYGEHGLIARRLSASIPPI